MTEIKTRKSSVRMGNRWDSSKDLPIAKLTLYQLSYGRSVPKLVRVNVCSM